MTDNIARLMVTELPTQLLLLPLRIPILEIYDTTPLALVTSYDFPYLSSVETILWLYVVCFLHLGIHINWVPWHRAKQRCVARANECVCSMCVSCPPFFKAPRFALRGGWDT